MNRLFSLVGLLSFACAMIASAQSSAARSVTGRIVDEGGLPLTDAAILLIPVGAANDSSKHSGLNSRAAAADGQGRFKVEDLDRGAYIVAAHAAGYVIDEENNKKYVRPGDSITVRMKKGGVITGTVTGPGGEPLVGIKVRAYPVKAKRASRYDNLILSSFMEWRTDDRGVYRMYGLQPGSYLVAAGGRGLVPYAMDAYGGDAPTYFPSSTRDGAKEVTVESGGEAQGIDIRYRDLSGHAVSGTVTGPIKAGEAIVISLTQASTGVPVTWTFAMMPGGNSSFEFQAISDGEYDVTALSQAGKSETLASAPRRVTVRGADVTGLELALEPLGSIAGRVALEQAPAAQSRAACEGRRSAVIQETIIAALPDRRESVEKNRVAGLPFITSASMPEGVPNEKGEILLSALASGRYRIAAELPTPDWFVRSITLTSSAPGAKPADVSRNAISLKRGEQLSNLVITIAEGAAGVRGRILVATEGGALRQRARVYLVPAEKESADDVLRYAEALAQSDGQFALGNLAPGRYWILAQAVDEKDGQEDYHPAAWSAEGRAKLRRAAEAANVALELKPCQRIVDYALRLAASQ